MSVTKWLQRSRSRGATHALLLGVVVGMLVTGVAVPFLFGERTGVDSVASGSGTEGINFDAPGGTAGTDPFGSGEVGGALGDPGDPGALGTPGAPDSLGTPGSPGSPGSPGTPGSPGSGAPGAPGAPAPGGAPGGDPAAPGAPGGPGAPAAPGNNGGATDQGVSATEVKIGVFTPACTDTGASFGFTCYDYTVTWRAFFDEINARGGMHGRKIKPIFYKYDPASERNMREQCVKATEGDKVFATVNWFGFYGRAITCVTDEHGVPFMSYAPEVDQWYNSGLHFSFGLSMNRMLRTQVDELDKVGLLRGKTLGIVDSTYPTIDLAVKNALLPELEARGIGVAKRCQLSNDLGEAQSQMPVCVQEMKAAGVDSVIFANNLVFTTLFVQQADNQAFRPQWLNSDVALGAQDLSTLVMPPSYDGAIAVTGWNSGEDLVGIPERAAEADCIRRYNAKTNGKHSREGERNDEDGIHYGAAIITCTMTDTVAYGIDKAGPRLTRKGYAAALTQRGEFDSTVLLGDSFRPGKPTSTDAVRFVRWHYNYKGRIECRCWVPISEPRRAAF